MPRQNSLDTLEIPAPLVIRHFAIKFVGTLATFLILSLFWGNYVLVQTSDIFTPFNFEGLVRVWPMFAWACAFGVLTLLGEGVDYLEERPVVFGRAVWVSLNAGIWEELIYRWLMFSIAMIMLPFFNFITFGLVGWINTTLLIPFSNWITFGALAPQLLSENWVLGAAILSATATFRDQHSYLGVIGWINSWFIGMVLFWLMFNYGIFTAIVAHVLYDLILFGTRAIKAR